MGRAQSCRDRIAGRIGKQWEQKSELEKGKNERNTQREIKTKKERE